MSFTRDAAIVAALCALCTFLCYFAPRSYAQLPDKTVTPNSANVGINKSFLE
jgi:hypothetical protein